MNQRQKGVIVQSILWARCPRCGKGALFKKFLQLSKECSNCKLDYSFIDTGDGPAIFAIFILGFTILGGALWVEFTFAPPLWVHIILWGFLTPFVAFVLLRFLKGLLASLQYMNDASEGRLEDQSLSQTTNKPSGNAR